MIRPSKRRPVGFIVRPGRSVGEFILGSKISEGFNYIRKNADIFTSVEFKYNEINPYDMAYILDLRSNGLELRYDPKSQRLCLIKVYDLSKLELSYVSEDRLVSSPESIPSLQMIYDKFGPTYAGQYSEDSTEYVLEYPGLAFTFPVKKELLPEKKDSRDMPKSLDIRLKTLHVWTDSYKDPNDDYSVMVNVGEGITVNLATALNETHSLDFTSSVQDVTIALGDPEEVFNKVDDPLSIHKNKDENSDFFYNYFRYGIDILFDGTTHTIKKFVLWTNMPSQPLFTKYEKCNYMIFQPEWAKKKSGSRGGSQQLEASISIFKPSTSPNTVSMMQKVQGMSADKDNLLDLHAPENHYHGVPKDEDGNDTDNRQTDSDDGLDVNVVRPDQRWIEIEDLLGPPVGKPFVSPGAEHSPYGGRQFKAYHDVIFEVMENGYVSKVILFKTK